MARTVVLIADLLFGSRVQESLRAAGHDVELVGGKDGLEDRLDGCEVLVVDLTDERLQGAEAVEEITADVGASEGDGAPSGESDRRLRTLGFYAHVDTDTRERARRAGFDLVVPRSRMAREGGELVARLASGR